MQRRALLSSGIVALGSLAGCVGAFGTTVTAEVSETHEVSPETVVSISNRNGDVTVDPTDDEQLTVTGLKRASSEEALDSVSVEVTPGEQFVVAVNFESGSEFDSRSVDLTVAVPDGVRVDRARTDNGDVDVDCLAMRGDVTCRTTSGDATVSVGEDVSATVRLETTNGSATVADVPHTVDDERRGFLRGQLRGGGESTLSVRSTNGDVRLDAA